MAACDLGHRWVGWCTHGLTWCRRTCATAQPPGTQSPTASIDLHRHMHRPRQTINPHRMHSRKHCAQTSLPQLSQLFDSASGRPTVQILPHRWHLGGPRCDRRPPVGTSVHTRRARQDIGRLVEGRGERRTNVKCTPKLRIFLEALSHLLNSVRGVHALDATRQLPCQTQHEAALACCLLSVVEAAAQVSRRLEPGLRVPSLHGRDPEASPSQHVVEHPFGHGARARPPPGSVRCEPDWKVARSHPPILEARSCERVRNAPHPHSVPLVCTLRELGEEL